MKQRLKMRENSLSESNEEILRDKQLGELIVFFSLVAHEASTFGAGLEVIDERKNLDICNPNTSDYILSNLQHFLYQPLKSEEIYEQQLSVNSKEIGVRHVASFLLLLEQVNATKTFTWNPLEHVLRMGYSLEVLHNKDFKRSLLAFYRACTGFKTVTTLEEKTKKNEKKRLKMQALIGSEGLNYDEEHNHIEYINIDLYTTGILKKLEQHTQKSERDYSLHLTRVLKEDGHPLSIYLMCLAVCHWKYRGECQFSLQQFFNYLQQPESAAHYQVVEKLEYELNYMKEKGYIQDWSVDGQQAMDKVGKNILQQVVTLYPVLEEDMGIINVGKVKKEFHAPLEGILEGS